MTRLERRFFERPAPEVAPALLNKVLVAPGVRGRIVEVEAYAGADDPASHAHRGPTPRSEVMFGPPGHLYVYFIYGVHWCVNIVCDRAGSPGAVLLRALRPLEGLDHMYRRRPVARRDRDLCNGPAKLAAAMGLDGRHDGLDLGDTGRGIGIEDDGIEPPHEPACGSRIGVTKGKELRWRWAVSGAVEVSRPAP